MKKAIIVEILIICLLISSVVFACVFFYNKFVVEPNIYTIEFKDIDGITKGSPVRFMGINCGYVKSLKTKNRTVEVKIYIAKDNFKIPNGASARVEFYGLGGSKSIEIMPPDEDTGEGIVSSKTLRLHDVLHETKGIAVIIESIEKMLIDLNGNAIEKTLESVSQLKNDKMTDFVDDFSSKKNQMSAKANKIKNLQQETGKKIRKANVLVEKFNKFIKK